MKIKLVGNTSMLLVTLLFTSCYYISQLSEVRVPSFEEVKGIKYSEVHRKFLNGLSIDDQGFHLEPEWQIYFTGDDSLKIFNKDKQEFTPYRIFHSHRDLYHFARNWFRVKHVSKDSIVLQVLKLDSRIVNEKASNVFMILYSDNYIKNTLHSTPELLRAPSSQDSLFAKYKAIIANSNPDSNFAARSPVIFKSKSKIASVRKIEPSLDPYLGFVNRTESYMSPEYVIYIDKAYRDFKYSFSVVVDHQGKMKFRRFMLNLFPEFIETKTKVAHGIIDVYLKNLLEVTPGKTLGFPHSSTVNLHVIGRANSVLNNLY